MRGAAKRGAVADRLRRIATAGNESSLATFLEPTPVYRALATASDMALLAGKTARIAIRPPFSWVRDAVVEASVALRRCMVPLAISQAVYNVGFAIIMFGSITYILGVPDRQPVGDYVGYLREINTWVTMMILAGVSGTALAADLGARKIRDELDALDVLGVDKLRALVVPRVVAMTVVAVTLPLLSHIIVLATNQLFQAPYMHLAGQQQIETMRLNVIPADLYSSLIKHTIMGVFLGVVACQKGLSARGGAEGVGRAVNQTVVVSFFGIWLINSLYNLAYLTVFPETQSLRG